MRSYINNFIQARSFRFSPFNLFSHNNNLSFFTPRSELIWATNTYAFRLANWVKSFKRNDRPFFQSHSTQPPQSSPFIPLFNDSCFSQLPLNILSSILYGIFIAALVLFALALLLLLSACVLFFSSFNRIECLRISRYEPFLFGEFHEISSHGKRVLSVSIVFCFYITNCES